MGCSRGVAFLGLQRVGIGLEDSRLVDLCAGIRSSDHMRPDPRLENDSFQPAAPRLEVRTSPGKGSGLFTVDRIAAHSKLLTDDALLSLAEGEDLPELWEKYCSLPTEQRSQFDALSFPSAMNEKEWETVSRLEQRGYTTSDAQHMARVKSRMQANAFKTRDANIGSPHNHRWAFAVFGTVARINHSCAPNACAHYRPSGAQVVYALRDVEPGEEIEIAYFDMTMPYAKRQARAEKWGFRCCCPLCSDFLSREMNRYEKRLSVLHAVLSQTDGYLDSATGDVRQMALAMAHSADYPWLRVALPKLYLALWQTTGGSDKMLLEKLVEWEEKITGVDSPTSIARRETVFQLYPVT